MSFSTGCRKCKKCGKMYRMSLFDGELCAECEKTEQEPIELDFKRPKKIVGKLISVEVLDKIRAEIESYVSEEPHQLMSKTTVLEIVDKYKTGMIEQMDTPICYCGTVMDIEKKRYSGGMGEWYDDWILSCPKCGIKKTYPADNFYGRDFISDEKTVIDTWNDMRREYR